MPLGAPPSGAVILSAVIEEDLLVEESTGPPVSLGVFSGPLDLLLHLIRKNEVSIYDIPIATICDQFQAHIEAMHELDLEIAGEFLWMASWLLALKSRLLLPRHEDEEEDPRQELVERLLEYRRVKELASILYEKDVVRRCLWSPGFEPELDPGEVELDWEEVDLRLLAKAYLEVMERFAVSHPPPLQILPLRYRVHDKMREIYRRVLADGLLALLRDLHRRADVEEVVALFVATLELVRVGAVCAEQGRPFAEIYLRPGPRELDLEDLERLDLEEAADGA
jgi:segregation and condensation protein A